MSHPFKLGGTYRNRDGEYEVVELNGPNMVIRYSDGRQIETTLNLQGRILKNIRAEERRRSQTDTPGPRPPAKPGGSRTTELGRLVEQHLEQIFIAYAFPYIDRAIAALEDAPPGIEAVTVQPFCKSRIVSARKAMRHYRVLTDGQHIPILFTSQTRHQDQVFEYGSRLLEVYHAVEIEKVRKEVDAGRCLIWDGSLYASNFLIVRAPIRELPVKPPIEIARNMLPGRTQGDPTGSVSIPAPKVLDPTFQHLLEDL